MREVIVAVLLMVGASFSLLAAIGIVRMPDLFSRMQASTKSATLGMGTILLAVAVHFGSLGVTTQVLLIIAFLFLTAPVAAHAIGRAGYFSGVPLWEGAVIDELRNRYEPETGQLRGPKPPAPQDEDRPQAAGPGQPTGVSTRPDDREVSPSAKQSG
jgi:multicomponent Na+:H+ antiporter subunit G